MPAGNAAEPSATKGQKSIANHLNRLEKKQRKNITFPEVFKTALEDQSNLTGKLLQQVGEALVHPDFDFDKKLVAALFTQFNAQKEFPKDFA